MCPRGLYKFCGDIGRGNFSRVKLAVHQLTRDRVAIKVVDRGRLDARALRMLSREVTTLECVHHPNILRLFEVVETLGRVHLVTEWIRGGELYNHITQNGPLKEMAAAPLFKQLLLAVKHMHNLGFVHRDIKAENVLLVTTERIKLADFGFSTQLINGAQQRLDTFCGSPPYAAPELFSDDHYLGGPVDVWALGVLVYFMVVGNMPFRAPTVPALRSAVLRGDFSLSTHLSLAFIRLIQRILVHTPSRRPSIDQMLGSQWVNEPDVFLSLSAKLAAAATVVAKPPNGSATKKSNWFSCAGSLRRATSGRDARHIEMSNLAPIQCNTKRSSSSFADNFLSPIDITTDEELVRNSEMADAIVAPTSTLPKVHARRSLFSAALKKKVGPSEDLERGKLFNRNSSTSIQMRTFNTSDLKNDLETRPPSIGVTDQANPFGEELGPFIMLPTYTLDLTQLHPLELEARCLLIKLGISSEVLLRSIESGPRSDIIGAYRIVLHRLQTQSWYNKQADLMAAAAAAQEVLVPKVSPKNLTRKCAIL